jgi:hypothetical protein
LEHPCISIAIDKAMCYDCNIYNTSHKSEKCESESHCIISKWHSRTRWLGIVQWYKSSQYSYQFLLGTQYFKIGSKKFSVLCDFMAHSFKWRKHYEELFRDNIFYKLLFKEADNYIKYRNVLSEKQDAKSHAIKDYETEVYISNLNLSL